MNRYVIKSIFTLACLCFIIQNNSYACDLPRVPVKFVGKNSPPIDVFLVN